MPATQRSDTRTATEKETDRAMLLAQFNASDSLRAEFDGSFERFFHYTTAIASGRARIHRGAGAGGIQ